MGGAYCKLLSTWKVHENQVKLRASRKENAQRKTTEKRFVERKGNGKEKKIKKEKKNTLKK